MVFEYAFTTPEQYLQKTKHLPHFSWRSNHFLVTYYYISLYDFLNSEMLFSPNLTMALFPKIVTPQVTRSASANSAAEVYRGVHPWNDWWWSLIYGRYGSLKYYLFIILIYSDISRNSFRASVNFEQWLGGLWTWSAHMGVEKTTWSLQAPMTKGFSSPNVLKTKKCLHDSQLCSLLFIEMPNWLVEYPSYCSLLFRKLVEH